MALLPEHDAYLVAMGGAYVAFRGALIDALGLQDNPQYACVANTHDVQLAYRTARVEFVSYLSGQGATASSTDSLKGYTEPANTSGPFALNPLTEILPKFMQVT